MLLRGTEQRRPLKASIAADIARDDDFAVAPEMTAAAVAWYQSHVGYDYAMAVAGSKRIDLNGREVGAVTEQEDSVRRAKNPRLQREAECATVSPKSRRIYPGDARQRPNIRLRSQEAGRPAPIDFWNHIGGRVGPAARDARGCQYCGHQYL
ncbi:ProQ/FINO family protein [Bradyrhizobium sp. USDA 4518]